MDKYREFLRVMIGGGGQNTNNHWHVTETDRKILDLALKCRVNL
jgi:hypothetical protein